MDVDGAATAGSTPRAAEPKEVAAAPKPAGPTRPSDDPAAADRSRRDGPRGLAGRGALLAAAAALLVVTTRQLVHAALWLVVTLGAVAGCYLLLAAEFVAWCRC